MPREFSAGAIIFRPEKKLKISDRVKKETNNFLFLLLHYQSGARRPRPFWDFPKGHIEKGENPVDATRREIKEETGIEDIKFIPGFKESIKYFFKFEGKTIFKTVIFFLVKTKEKEVKISGEHIGFEWLPYEEAVEKLTYKNAKEILKKANGYILKHET